LQAGVFAGQGATKLTGDIIQSYTAMADQCEISSVDCRRKISAALKLGGQYGTLVLAFTQKDSWSNSFTKEQPQHGQFTQVSNGLVKKASRNGHEILD
jgi:hypothetical protein